MRRLLFICSQNKLRSPAAETIFTAHPGIEVDSAGLNNGVIVPLSHEQLRWADTIIVMETAHRTRLNRNFSKSLAGKRIAVLGIPDNYDYMDEEFIRLLKSKCRPYLP